MKKYNLFSGDQPEVDEIFENEDGVVLQCVRINPLNNSGDPCGSCWCDIKAGLFGRCDAKCLAFEREDGEPVIFKKHEQ